MTDLQEDPIDPDITSKLFTDYVNVFLQCAFVLVGLPVNISTLVYIWNKYRHARSFLLLLHINLNITDILVLAVYSTGYVGWLITYEWVAGDLLCKIMRFSDVVIFAASSNIMVCIAVYRLCALRSPMWVSAVGHSRVPRIVLSAWAVAVLIAFPQLFIWKTSTAEFQMENGTVQTAHQCVSMWTAKLNSNTSLTERDHTVMLGYNMSQILVIFYVPLAIVATCYVLILRDIYSTLAVDCDESSVLYAAEITRLSSCGKRRSQTKSGDEAGVILQHRALRGQDKFQRAKVRSLRITLLLILTYIITWLPYNLLSWLMMLQFEIYREYEDVLFFLHNLVVLNSVINPFIYGRCQGLKLIFRCGATKKELKKRDQKKKQAVECCL